MIIQVCENTLPKAFLVVIRRGDWRLCSDSGVRKLVDWVWQSLEKGGIEEEEEREICGCGSAAGMDWDGLGRTGTDWDGLAWTGIAGEPDKCCRPGCQSDATYEIGKSGNIE